MNCRDCQAQLADLSVEALASDQTQAMHQHFEECSHCYQEWAVFERTLFVVSSAHQPLPSPLATEQMWHQCAEHIFQKVEAERARNPQSSSSQSEYLNRPATTPARQGWFARQPSWGWASLLGAFALFGAVWFLAPNDVANPADFNQNMQPETQFVAVQNPNLENPPTMAANLVTHHAAISIDPFTDYVGTTMVSYSATPTANSSAASR